MECNAAYVSVKHVYGAAFNLDSFDGCGLVKNDTVCENSCSGPFEKEVCESSFELVGPDPKNPKNTIVLAASNYAYRDED